MLPDKPEVKRLGGCTHGELIRIDLEDEVLFAIYCNIKGFPAIVSLGVDGKTKYIDPCHKGSDQLLNSYKSIFVLSYGSDWRIEINNLYSPVYCSIIDGIGVGDIVLTLVKDNTGATVSRSYICASKSEREKLLMRIENEEIMDGINWPSFAFPAWDLFVGKGSSEAIFSHRPAIAQGDMAGAI